MKRKVLSLLSVLALTVSMAGCTIGSPEVLPGDEVLKHDVVFDDDISDDNPSDIGSTVQASVYEGVYLQDDIGQFDFHSLAVEAVSENELLIQFRLSEGDESGDGASEVFARIFEFDGNDAWVYSSEDQSGAPVVISVTFDDNNVAHVTHENDLWAVNPDGVYAFDEVMEAEFKVQCFLQYLWQFQ